MKKVLLLFVMLLIGQRMNAQTASLPYFQDFEESNGGWFVGTGAPLIQIQNVWQWGEPTNAVVEKAASGKKAWYTTLKNNPSNFYGAPYIESPVFDLKAKPAKELKVSFKIARSLVGENIGAFIGVKFGDWDWDILSREDPAMGYNIGWPDFIQGWADMNSGWVTISTTVPVYSWLEKIQFGVAFRHLKTTPRNANIGVAIDDFKIDIVRRPPINIADSMYLVSFYKSTDGKNWKSHKNWLETSVYHWEGIGTEEGRVTSIYLGNNNLKGKIPNGISKMSELHTIYANNNLLSGGLPSDLPLSPKLRTITLNNNQLTGNIPYFSRIFPDLSFNRFTSIARPPAKIYSLASKIDHNRLTFEDLEPYFEQTEQPSHISHYSPQDSIGELKTFVVDAGSTIKLTAEYTGNSPNNGYRWYKDGKIITKLTPSPYLVIKNLPAGSSSFYQCAVYNTKVPGLPLWTRKNYVKVRDESEKVIYRVNAGGGYIINDTPLNWSTDTRFNPSPYITTTTNTLTEGACWAPDLINTTGAPNCIFGSLRVGWAEGLKYKFPVANGTYRVNLYFAAKMSATSVPGKTFNVLIENDLKLQDFDIFATAGFAAVSKSFAVNITDGFINIDLTKSKGNPQINGIEISSLAATPEATAINRLEEPVVFPSPWDKGDLRIQLKGYQKGAQKIEITDKQGSIKYSGQLTKLNGSDEIILGASANQLSPGLYFLKYIPGKMFQK